MATHQWCWLQCPKDEAYPSCSSKWPFSEMGEMTSNHVSQRLSADWLWIRSWQARPNYPTHWKLSATNSVWTSKDQNLGIQLASDDTHCLDTRRRLPREPSVRRWSKSLTHQAPMHLLFDSILKFIDENRCCSDPTLPHELSGRCLCPGGAKKHPHLFALFVQIHAAAPVWFCRIDATRQNTRRHPIENDGLKHATNWMHSGYVDNTAQMEILTKTSSRDHVTSTLTRKADRVKCDRSWCTGKKLPPRRSGSMREETLAIIPRLGYTAPASSTMMSSQKGYSLSLRTKEPSIFYPAVVLLLQDS